MPRCPARVAWQAVSAEPLPQLAHRAEVQELRLFEGGAGGAAVLASVDCYGRAVLAHCRRDAPEGPLQVAEVSSLQPQDPLR